MVKVAKTDEEKKRVFEWLKAKGTTPATNHFWYKENEKGEIVGAYGLENKLFIEPMQSEDKLTALELITSALTNAQTIDGKAHVVTDNEKVKDILVNRYGALKWSTNVDELMIVF